jgi:hypothetical protein
MEIVGVQDGEGALLFGLFSGSSRPLSPRRRNRRKQGAQGKENAPIRNSDFHVKSFLKG